MFIIKLGAEALNRLEEQLSVNCKENDKIKKNVNGNNSYSSVSKPESSILYSLLSCDEGSSTKPKSILFPDYMMSRLESNLPSRANTISYSKQTYYEQTKIVPRPYSAPQTLPDNCIQKNRKRKQPEFKEEMIGKFNKACKVHLKSFYLPAVNSPSISCSTDSFGDEPMDLSRPSDNNFHKPSTLDDGKLIVDSWLLKLVSLINSSSKPFSSSLTELPPNIRLHLLQSSWHRIFVTYLYEHLSKLPGSFVNELWTFVQSVTGTTNMSVLGKKNMSCMYKNLIDDLNLILYQIRKLDLDEMSMNFLRIGLFLTGNQDENSHNNLKLIELFIQSKTDSSESDLQSISDIVDNLLKLNSVIVETIFYGHLNDNVENLIEQLFANS